MSIVRFDNVSRIYTSGDHELRALDHVSFTLDEGAPVGKRGVERMKKGR